MKTRNISLKWKIFQYFCLFAGILIGLLWLIQTVFLNDFYRAIKISEIKSLANEIETAFYQDTISTNLMEIANRYDGCIVIADSHGFRVVSSESLNNCPLMFMKSNDLKTLMIEAASHHGSYLKEYEAYSIDQRPILFLPKIKEVVSQHIIYTKIIHVNQSAYGVMVNTNVVPLDATVQTIQIQLIFITAVMVILALILALLVSKYLTKPIANITASSKELAKGNYETVFDGSGYKESVQLAQSLNFAANELGKVDRMQKELVANISHDLRTPLTMISGYAELMRDLPDEMTNENLQTVIDETKRLTSLVNDVLDISKLQEGSQEFNKKTINLTQLVMQIINRYNTLLGHEGYQIAFDFGIDVMIQADELQLTQVIYNLMNNAVTYTGDDKQISVKQMVDETQHFVTISIRDTGEGIPAQQIKDIWNRYYKIDQKHRRAAIGSGLGLSIVREILIRHQAEYGVESVVGEGSTFWFRFPFEK